MIFELRFPEGQIQHWEQAYLSRLDEKECAVESELGPKAWRRGFVTRDDLLQLANWKSPRTLHHIESNSESYIREVSRTAFVSKVERFRIEVLTLLSGVGWPTASVILHLVHEDLYPILDFRALWSLGLAEPPPYNFQLWTDYTGFCRRLAQENGISMRTLDRALWQYSKEQQVRAKGSGDTC